MRFAEALLLAAISIAMAGCALLPALLPLPPAGEGRGEGQAIATPPAQAAPVAIVTPIARDAAVTTAPAPPPIASEPPVSPAAQRAFDDARRLLAAGRIEDAERAFAALAKSHPDLGGAHANLGLIHRRAGKLVEAVASLEHAVRASPKQPLFHNQLGIAYRENGQFAKAREAYEQAIALDAGYAAPVLNLGILHDLYLRDGARALELYDRYLAIAAGKDATVTKWVADLKNRKPDKLALNKKEQP